MTGSGWKFLRGRGVSAARGSLIICSVIAIGIVILGRAQASIFDSARAKLTDWTAPTLAKVHEPVSAFERWVAGLTNVFSVYRENVALRKENAELRKWQDVALSLGQRMHRYDLLLHAVPDAKMSAVTARVVGQSSRPFAKTMILNAGRQQNIQTGQAVLDDRGLIGRVYLIGDRSAWVIPLTDLNSRVPVIVQPANRRAILAGDNTPSPQLELDLGTAPVKAGDRILSTGDGGLLPPDIPVGVVVAEGSHLRVALFTDPDASDYVKVMNYNGPGELPSADNVPHANMVPAETPSTNTIATAAAPARPSEVPRATTPAAPSLSAPPDAPDDEDEDR